LLIHYGWWFIIDDNNISGGYFAVLGDVTKFWVGFLKLFLMSILVMLLHIIVFDGPSSKREKWRFALTPVVYPVTVLFAFILLKTIFLYNQEFRMPPNNIGVLDPVKIYFVTLVGAHIFTILFGLFFRMVIKILYLTGMKNG
jgi:hypothetical protein